LIVANVLIFIFANNHFFTLCSNKKSLELLVYDLSGELLKKMRLPKSVDNIDDVLFYHGHYYLSAETEGDMEILILDPNFTDIIPQFGCFANDQTKEKYGSGIHILRDYEPLLYKDNVVGTFHGANKDGGELEMGEQAYTYNLTKKDLEKLYPDQVFLKIDVEQFDFKIQPS
jgi:hypothetical protein